MSNRTVKEIYDIDVNVLCDKAEQSDYWEGCLKFYSQVEDKPIEELTDKQASWMDKIEHAHRR